MGFKETLMPEVRMRGRLMQAVALAAVLCGASAVPLLGGPQAPAGSEPDGDRRTLIDALTLPTEAQRFDARRRLVAGGESSRMALVRRFREPGPTDDALHVQIARALVDFGDPGVADLAALGPAAVPATAKALLQMPGWVLNEHSPRVDHADERLLEALKNNRAPAVAYLAPLPFQGPEMEGAIAVVVLGRLGDRSTIEALTLALGDTSPPVRDNAIEALGRVGDERECLVLLGTAGASDNRQLQAALLFMGPRMIPCLEAAVKGEDSRLQALLDARREAALALCHLGEPGLDALRRSHPGSSAFLTDLLLRTPAEPIATAVRRVAAREALAKYAHQALADDGRVGGALDALYRAPASSSDLSPLSSPAAEALVPDLLARLGDLCKGSFQFDNAAAALGVIGDKRAVAPLIRGLSTGHCDGFLHGQSQVQEASAIALGRIGDTTAVGPLRDFLQDTEADPIPRRAAAEALGKLGDAESARSYFEAPLSHRRPVLHMAWLLSIGLVIGPLFVHALRRRDMEDQAKQLQVALFVFAAVLGLLTGVRALGRLPVDRQALGVISVLAAGLVVSILALWFTARVAPTLLPPLLVRSWLRSGLFALAGLFGAAVLFWVMLLGFSLLFIR